MGGGGRSTLLGCFGYGTPGRLQPQVTWTHARGGAVLRQHPPPRKVPTRRPDVQNHNITKYTRTRVFALADSTRRGRRGQCRRVGRRTEHASRGQRLQREYRTVEPLGPGRWKRDQQVKLSDSTSFLFPVFPLSQLAATRLFDCWYPSPPPSPSPLPPPLPTPRAFR